MEVGVVKPEMVADLVNHRHRHLVNKFLFRVAVVLQRVLVDRDGVRKMARMVGGFAGERNPFILLQDVG